MSETNENEITVIIAGGETGQCLVYGYADKYPEVGVPCTLRRARMVLRFDRHGVFGLAAKGPVGDTRLTPVVARTTDTPKQVIEVSPEAAEAIDGWAEWSG